MIDQTAILDAILKCDASALARETGARLVTAWIDKWADLDSQWNILAVETPFYIWLDEKTLIVGCMDGIIDDEGICGLEWKTSKPARVTKAGVPYKGESPEDWLRGLRSGIQLGVYGLALQQGTFVDADDLVFPGLHLRLHLTGDPRILIRAITKSDIPDFWPPDPRDGLITLDLCRLTATEEALLSRAAQIRGARLAGRLPWAWPGFQCKAGGEYECPAYSQCSKLLYPPGEITFSVTDPGYKAISSSGADLSDPELVILGASAYGTSQTCMEMYRRVASGLIHEESMALSVGTVFHTGVAEMYRQIQSSQKASVDTL